MERRRVALLAMIATLALCGCGDQFYDTWAANYSSDTVELYFEESGDVDPYNPVFRLAAGEAGTTLQGPGTWEGTVRVLGPDCDEVAELAVRLPTALLIIDSAGRAFISNDADLSDLPVGEIEPIDHPACPPS